MFSNGFVMIQKEKKKSQELDALFTFDQQQDEAALVKFASSSWLLSMSCRLTKVIGISFFIFRVNLREGFSFTVDCCFGFQYWLQPATTGIFAVGPRSYIPRTIIRNIIFLTAEAGSVITIVLSRSK